MGTTSRALARGHSDCRGILGPQAASTASMSRLGGGEAVVPGRAGRHHDLFREPGGGDEPRTQHGEEIPGRGTAGLHRSIDARQEETGHDRFFVAANPEERGPNRSGHLRFLIRRHGPLRA